MSRSSAGPAVRAGPPDTGLETSAAPETLRVEDITLRFGGVTALDGPSFTVEPGEICGLIGPNGAGKTSLFNCVSRLYTPAAGRITFGEVDLLGLRPHRIAELGIARTFQNLALFPELSVLDNVVLGAYSASHTGLVRNCFRTRTVRVDERDSRTRARQFLALLGLDHIANQAARGLPYGTLKRIELARALMVKPRLLLLDEPASGLTHEEVAELGEVVKMVRDRFGPSVLLVEHHMGMVLGISDHLVVLDMGKKIADGTPDVVRTDRRVIEAYLGEA